MAKTPYFNKRRWLESRQDEITELYRTGKSWHEIVEHLKQFTKAGNQVYFLVGNRDFALGKDMF